jgi:hypothetical protein
MFTARLVLLLAAATSPALAADTANPWRRWAVVCSQEPRENGLGDLLTSELSKAPGIELVERERLAAVESELEISSLLGSAAGGRLQLGRMLRPDALILISRGGKGRRRTLSPGYRRMRSRSPTVPRGIQELAGGRRPAHRQGRRRHVGEISPGDHAVVGRAELRQPELDS